MFTDELAAVEAAIEFFEKHLDDHPDDWNIRGLLADAYEDFDKPHNARFQRWLVEHKKAPASSEIITKTTWGRYNSREGYEEDSFEGKKGLWWWFSYCSTNKEGEMDFPKYCLLESWYTTLLTPSTKDIPHIGNGLSSRIEAECWLQARLEYLDYKLD